MIVDAFETLFKKVIGVLDYKSLITILLLLIIGLGVFNNTMKLDSLIEKEYRHGYQVMKSIEDGSVSLDPNSNQYIGTKPALKSDLKDACLNNSILKRLEYYFDTAKYCKLIN